MSLDLDFLYNMNEGPLRSGLIVLGVALVSVLVAILLHRMGVALVRRLARGRPFTTTATQVTFNASRTCVILFMLRLVLAGAPDNTPGITRISYLTSVAFILALTWFLMRCVKSVSTTSGWFSPPPGSHQGMPRPTALQPVARESSMNEVPVSSAAGCMPWVKWMTEP
jgi:hypothetical protein